MTTCGADIQVELGNWSKVRNEIWELLAQAPLRGQQFRCLMFLFRKTYGYNKKEDKISLAEWASGTGLKRQNVWRELELLIKCNVIYKKSNGPKRPNTWGFNKHHEQWNFQSVITEDDSSVITSDYSQKQSVITSDDKSVITPHERTKDKERSSKEQPAAAFVEDEDGDSTVALVRLAYESVCRIGPPMRSDEGKANLITASRLIERYGFATCIRNLSTLKERNHKMILKNARNGIRAPLPYLETLIEGDDSPATPIAIAAPATVDFALEEIVL